MKYLCANWKMNPRSLAESQALLDEVVKGLQGVDLADKKVIVCPPYPYLQSKVIARPYFLGAQNCGYTKEGAFTGEVSPAMLKDLGIQYVILGHSERRRFFKEDNEMIAKKVNAALEAGLAPILCVGSLKQENDDAERKEIKEQLTSVFRVLTNDLYPKPYALLIAYEPVWAISTSGRGKVATPEQAKSMIDFIKSFVVSRKSLVVGCLYGGSVDAHNIKSFTSLEGIDGALVGGASLDAKEFVQLVANA